MENKEIRRVRPKLNIPNQHQETRIGSPVLKTPIQRNVTSNIRGENDKTDRLNDLFNYKNEELSIKNDTKMVQKEIDIIKDSKATIIPTNEWKRTFRTTDSIELSSLIQYSSVSNNALLRITGSYSTKMLSNLRINSKELSGIETRPTKVFFNQTIDIRQAIKTNLLSYIPYSVNYFSLLEKEIVKKMYIDDLLVLNEKLFFSLFVGQKEILDTECIALTRKNIINNDINIREARDSLKIFITEENNTEEVLSTITKNLQQDFLLFTLDRQNKTISLQIYNKEDLTPFSTDNLKILFKDKIRYLNNYERYEDAKDKYNRKK